MPKSTERFDAALLFASWLHCHQTRKGSDIPYISHLLAVTSLVIEAEGREDEAIAALLHDSIEDCGDSYPGGRDTLRDYIRTNFGDDVLEIVDGCVDDEGHEKGTALTAEEEARRWRARKEAYLVHLSSADCSVKLVSCADKLHNARAILADCRQSGESVWQRFRRQSREDQVWHYGQLARIFKQAMPGRLAYELEETVSKWK